MIYSFVAVAIAITVLAWRSLRHRPRNFGRYYAGFTPTVATHRGFGKMAGVAENTVAAFAAAGKRVACAERDPWAVVADLGGLGDATRETFAVTVVATMLLGSIFFVDALQHAQGELAIAFNRDDLRVRQLGVGVALEGPCGGVVARLYRGHALEHL